ncbi:MAG: ABC transporter ATP-binding protein [Bacilli bacterium]
MNIIETKNLTKYYGDKKGIEGLTMSVKEGEIFGFIGPNGAGKSTTIRTLLSLIYKTSGEAKIFGLDTEKDNVKILENVGYVPSEVAYYDNMKPLELFNYSASFYNKDCTERIKYLCNRLNLDTSKKIEDMSLGNKKKVAIIVGLLHSPLLLILDEPTSGLDPLVQKEFFELIKEENKKGVSVLFSSHILSVVQKVCTRVAIIKDGAIIETKNINDLRNESYKKISFTTLDDPKSIFKDFAGVSNYKADNNTISFVFKGNVDKIVKTISKYTISNIDIVEPSLEEIFLHYYGE